MGSLHSRLHAGYDIPVPGDEPRIERARIALDMLRPIRAGMDCFMALTRESSVTRPESFA